MFSLAEDKNCDVITIYNLQYLQQQTTAVTWAGPGRHLQQTKVTELPMKVRFTELPHSAEVLEVFGSLYYLCYILSIYLSYGLFHVS